jgi:uncharacterized protein YndB with AHSA1/START domain
MEGGQTDVPRELGGQSRQPAVAVPGSRWAPSAWSVEKSILIDAPREKIWEFTTNPETFTVWQSNLVSFEPDGDGSPHLGSTAHCTTRVAGRNVEYTMKATSWDPGKGNVWTSEDSPIPFVYTSKMEDVDGQTRVTNRLESDGFGGFFGKLGEPIVTRMYGHDMDNNLHQLKELMEQ